MRKGIQLFAERRRFHPEVKRFCLRLCLAGFKRQGDALTFTSGQFGR